MRIEAAEITFKSILPSALVLLLIGCTAFFLYPRWTWFGVLGLNAIALGLLLGLAMYALSYLLTCSERLTSQSMRLIMQNLRAMFANFTWPQIIATSILAGVSEELLMRGFLQTGLQEYLNPLLVIVLVALIFGLMHFMNFTYMLLTFFGGLILGAAFYLSESLIMVIIGHIVYDICAFAVIVKFPHMLSLQSSNERNADKSKHWD